LLKAFDARPFGDPAAVAAAAKDVAAWSDQVLTGLQDVRYDDRQTLRLLNMVAEAAHRKPEKRGVGLGYDDAQQLLWAFDVLRAECPGVKDKAELATELQKLGGPEPDKAFLLRLWDASKPRQLIVNELPGRLRRVRDYQPEPFRQTFERIAAALKAE
jgi:hypothetical protein